MKKSVRSLLSSVAALGTTVCMGLSVASLTSSAEESANAYVFLRSVSESARFEGIDATVNTISDGASTAVVDKDGSYSVSIDVSKESGIDSIDEISILKVYVCGTKENLADASVKVDSLKIDDKEVSLSAEPECMKSEAGTEIFIDLYDTNGTTLFNRTDYQDISKINVDFTVSGWTAEAEETTTAAPAETTTAAESSSESKETTTTAAASSTATEVPKTGVNSVAGVVAVMGLAAAGVMFTRKKNN